MVLDFKMRGHFLPPFSVCGFCRAKKIRDKIWGESGKILFRQARLKVRTKSTLISDSFEELFSARKSLESLPKSLKWKVKAEATKTKYSTFQSTVANNNSRNNSNHTFSFDGTSITKVWFEHQSTYPTVSLAIDPYV